MSNWDKEYLKLCRRILSEGTEIENRTGINSIKVPEQHFEFDLNKEFPILSIKQMFYRQAVTEMLWIWQMSSNDVRDLQERNVHVWDEWMIDEDGIYRIYEPEGSETPYDPDREVKVIDPLSVPIDDPNGLRHEFKQKINENGKPMTAKSLIKGRNIKAAKYYGKDLAYTIGTAYGFITGRYNHAKNLIDTFKQNPSDRRQVKSLWQDEFLRTAVLPSCVWSTTWDITDDKLSLSVNQRSCDVPLGLPFNITQYATFLSMIAKELELDLGKMYYNIVDPHIYVNQVDGIKEQIAREDKLNELKLLEGEDLVQLKSKLAEILDRMEKSGIDKNDQEYRKYDTEYRMIDSILEPTTPELVLNDEIQSFFDYDNSKNLKDVKVKNYKHLGKVRMPIAQ